MTRPGHQAKKTPQDMKVDNDNQDLQQDSYKIDNKILDTNVPKIAFQKTNVTKIPNLPI